MKKNTKRKTVLQELKERGYKNPKKVLALLKKAGIKEIEEPMSDLDANYFKDKDSTY